VDFAHCLPASSFPCESVQARRGRTQTICERWEQDSFPRITNALCLKYALEYVPSEFARAQPGSSKQKDLVNKVRIALRRHSSERLDEKARIDEGLSILKWCLEAWQAMLDGKDLPQMAEAQAMLERFKRFAPKIAAKRLQISPTIQ